MTVYSTENPAIQVPDNPEETKNNNNLFRVVERTLTRQRTPRQTIGDLLVTFVAIPLLVACAILLYSCMKSDWVRDGHMRLRVLVLGMTLLFVSLMVCVYTTKRLGMCSWPTAEEQALPERRIRRRTLSSRVCPAPLLPNNSQQHLILGGELPPSYDSVIGSTDQPPPYCHITYCSEVTRSTLNSFNAGARPPGMG